MIEDGRKLVVVNGCDALAYSTLSVLNLKCVTRFFKITATSQSKVSLNMAITAHLLLPEVIANINLLRTNVPANVVPSVIVPSVDVIPGLPAGIVSNTEIEIEGGESSDHDEEEVESADDQNDEEEEAPSVLYCYYCEDEVDEGETRCKYFNLDSAIVSCNIICCPLPECKKRFTSHQNRNCSFKPAKESAKESDSVPVLKKSRHK